MDTGVAYVFKTTTLHLFFNLISIKLIIQMSRLRKYSRDGLRTARPTANSSTLTSEPINRPHGYKPVNLTDKNIEQSLVQLFGRGPSFVPTPLALTGMDCN